MCIIGTVYSYASTTSDGLAAVAASQEELEEENKHRFVLAGCHQSYFERVTEKQRGTFTTFISSSSSIQPAMALYGTEPTQAITIN